MSITHSWLSGVVVKTPEFKYMNFCFWKERPSLISLILNLKYEKPKYVLFYGNTSKQDKKCNAILTYMSNWDLFVNISRVAKM